MSKKIESPAPENDHHGLVLSDLQHRLITTALAALSVFVIFSLFYLLFKILTALVSGFSNVLLPLAIAAILAMLLRPVVGWMAGKTRLSRTGSIITLYALVLFALAVGLWLVVPVIIEQTIQFVQSLPSIYQGLRDSITDRFPQLMGFLNNLIGEEKLVALGQQLKEQLAGATRNIALTAATLGTEYLKALFGFTAAVAIIPVYLFFFLRSDKISTDQLEHQMSWIRKDIREDMLFLGRHFANSIETFFQGQILVGLIMGMLLATGFTIAGVEFGFALGFLIGLLNIIPYLGTIIGLGAVLPIAYFQPEGGLILAAVALAIFVVVQIIEGYLLTPRIMGNRTGLHPLTIIIAIFFWGTALGGILGMILAIPLTAFFVVAWRLLREKYLNKWTTNA